MGNDIEREHRRKLLRCNLHHFRGRVSYEDTFFRLRIGLLSIFVRDAYIRNAFEHLEVREDWIPSNEDLVWS